MKKLNFLRNLFGPVADLQSNDVSVDRHSTVVRPSFDRRDYQLKGVTRLAAMLCLLFTLGVGNAWGADAPVNTVLWGENFAHFSANDIPSSKGTGSGTTIYGGATITYAQSSSNTKAYTESLAGGTSPELLLAKSSTTWTISGIKTGGATEMGLTFLSNKTTFTVTVSSSNLEVTGSGQSWTISLKSGKTDPGTFNLVIKNTGSSNARVDNVELKVTTAAAAPTYTLKVSNGLGGYTTYSSKVKSDLTQATAEGGNSCASGLQGYYSGWRTSSLETPAGSPGTTYNHVTAGDMPADGSTLYAVYYSSGEGGYLTNTHCEETCANSVTPAAGTKTNVTTIAFNKSSVETCSETASDRQVTVTITPASCYAVPSSTRLTVSGATYVSGPTDNGNGTYSFVYQFAQNATGTKTFDASLSTTATYTVSYAAGSVPSGGGSITGSHVNDSKTCGTSMALPGETFHTTGYTQTGWSKTNGGSQYAAVGGSYTDNAAQTFYPVWTANKYTVTWSVNGSTYTTTSNVSYNTTTSTPANPSVPVTCSGAVFRG